MKSIAFVVLFCVASFALQQPEETITVPKRLLSQQQLDQASFEQTKVKAEQYGQWVGVGKEIGVAVDSSLSAISSRASEFADTKVGKIAIAVVIFKVIGIQVMQFFIGTLMLFIGVPVWIWSFRRLCVPRRVVKSVIFDPATKQKTHTYETVDPRGDYCDVSSAAAHVLTLAAFLVISILVIFLH